MESLYFYKEERDGKTLGRDRLLSFIEGQVDWSKLCLHDKYYSVTKKKKKKKNSFYLKVNHGLNSTSNFYYLKFNRERSSGGQCNVVS